MLKEHDPARWVVVTPEAVHPIQKEEALRDAS